MMLKSFSTLSWLASGLLLAGCATGPVNTENPSTSDLLFRWDELGTYLDQRRGELDQRQAELVAVNTRLTEVLRALGDENDAVDELRGEEALSAGLAAQLDLELGQLRTQSSQLRGMLTAVQRDKATLEAQRLENQEQSRADSQRVSKLRTEITDLERQVVVLERNLDRFRESRKRSMLRN